MDFGQRHFMDLYEKAKEAKDNERTRLFAGLVEMAGELANLSQQVQNIEQAVSRIQS